MMTRDEYIARYGIPPRWEDVDLTDPPPRWTYRQWLAGLAMQAIIGNPNLIDSMDSKSLIWMSERAVSAADELIAALEKNKDEESQY